jgi:hypothetical protein
MGIAVARTVLGEPSAISRPGCGDTLGCMVAGGLAAAGDEDDAETAVAKGEVEADGVPDILASFPPGEISAAASTTVEDKIAATPDDKTSVALGDEGRTAIPGGTTSDNTGSGRVLPCMNERTREGCKVRGVDLEGIVERPETIRCSECTRARSTNSFPLGVVGELLYGVRASVTPADGAAAFP